MRKTENMKGNGERTKRKGMCRTERYIVLKRDLRKAKLLKDQKIFFWLPGNQLKLLGHYWHWNLWGRTESRNVKHPCLWQIVLASSHELALPAAPCCSEMSASDAVRSAGTHLECTTETCPGQFLRPNTLGTAQLCCPCMSAWSCGSG